MGFTRKCLECILLLINILPWGYWLSWNWGWSAVAPVCFWALLCWLLKKFGFCFLFFSFKQDSVRKILVHIWPNNDPLYLGNLVVPRFKWQAGTITKFYNRFNIDPTVSFSKTCELKSGLSDTLVSNTDDKVSSCSSSWVLEPDIGRLKFLPWTQRQKSKEIKMENL